MSSNSPRPEPPYYAVIFTSQRTDEDAAGYEEMAEKMAELASRQPGYLGIDSVRNQNGAGITVSYWSSLEAIQLWRQQTDHQLAQSLGRTRWYESYQLRVTRVERAYGLERSQ